MIGVGEEFPFFELNGVNGDKEIITATLDDYDGWKIIYFYPKDFTFICPTEIAGFDSINVDADIIGISGDNEFCKLAWRESNDLIADCTHDLLADCGLVLADELEIVDEDNYIQHVSVNALDTGRNHEEIERTINALQAGGLTGCQWEAGDDFVA